jgi:hypothetical protein
VATYATKSQLRGIAFVPRYFFDLHNDIDVTDGEGKELSGLAEAQRIALDEAREMIAASVETGEVNLNHFIQVRDEAGEMIQRLSFGQAVTIIPQA